MSDPLPFETPKDWNDWLAQNHATQSEVWVLFHKKETGVPSITWQDAVVEALCWGWIDGIRKSVNDRQWMQRYTPRKPRSAWSMINRTHAERLMSQGKMQASGQRMVDLAKANGQWEAAYSGGKDAAIPQDFLDAVALATPAAQATFATLTAQDRFSIYYRLTTAKRPETRAKRFATFLQRLEEGRKPVE